MTWLGPSCWLALTLLPAIAACSDDALHAPVDVALLPGEATASARAALPALPIPEPEAASIVDLGPISAVIDRLVVMLADDATVGAVNALGQALDARAVGAIPELGVLVLGPRVATTDLAWVTSALAVSRDFDAAENVLPSIIEAPQIIPVAHAEPAAWSYADPDGWDWGLQFMNVPRAWNLRRLLLSQPIPDVVVFDGNFGTHPDVTFDPDTPITPGSADLHGTSVAGAIAAHWDAVGIEGVMPVPVAIHGRATRIAPYPAENMAQALVIAIGAARQADRPLVVNMSLGHNLWGIDRQPDGTWRKRYAVRVDERISEFDASYADIAGAVGRLLARVSAYTASGAGAWDRWLMVCSAGNSNMNAARQAEIRTATGIELGLAEVQARTNSGCAAAAAKGDPHFMSVEALTAPGDALTSFSSRGGTVAAPGADLGVLSGDSYKATSGTSFSAPLVAGAAAFLWTYHPAASVAQVRDALLSPARGGAGGSAKRIDLWESVKFLDGLGGPDLGPWLADVDDGSVDGSSRMLPDGTAAAIVVPDQRGDGCVDMADFRAFRDALFDVTPATGGHAALGTPASPHRDQNGDGAAEFVNLPHERSYSRFDLDGDGTVAIGDLEVLRAHFGTCRDGVTTASTEFVTSAQVASLVASVDLFMKLPVGDGDVRLVSPGRATQVITAADLPRRTVAGHLLVTLPASSCDGALNVRLSRDGEAASVFATPTASALELGRDYVLDGALPVDPRTPLVHTHSGPNVVEAVVYKETGYDAVALEPPFLAAPSWRDANGTRHTRAAGTLTGGRVAIATDGVVRTWKLPGVSEDLVARAWSADGQGLVLANTSAPHRLFWIDLVREATAEVAPAAQLSDAWPQIVDGFIYYTTLDGLLARAPTYAADVDWSATVLGTDTCTATYTLAAPEVVLVLSAFGSEVTLPRAYPGALSAGAERVAIMVKGGGGPWQLRVVSLDGPDAAQALTIDASWEPRGGFETFNLDASDGVAWSPDGSLVAYATSAGVKLATPGALDAPVLVHDAPGAIAFAPQGEHLAVVTTEGPIQSRVARVHVYSPPWGRVADAIYVHDHRHGAVAWSADGKQIAIVEKEAPTSAKGDVVIYAPPATTPISTTATWTDPCGGATCTTTIESMPAWDRDLWPW